MTFNPIYIWMLATTVLMIASGVLLWLLIEANERANNNRLGEMHWREQIAEANRRIENAISERDSWEGACHVAEDKIEAMESEHQIDMNRRIIKIIHLNVPAHAEKTIAG